MTKNDFVKSLAEKQGITQAKAAALFDAVLEGIFEATEEDGSFRTTYGTFKMKETSPRPARVGRNPRTGEEVKIAARPAMKKITFSMSKSYKDNLNS